MSRTVAKFEKVSFEEWREACAEIDTPPNMTHDAFLNSTYNRITLPKRATKGSVGYDFLLQGCFTYAPQNQENCRNGRWFPTGVRCQIADGYYLQLSPRSNSYNSSLFRVISAIGIIDPDYYNAQNEGHIKVFGQAVNQNANTRDVEVLQGIFLPYYLAEEKTPTAERVGGFGSTIEKPIETPIKSPVETPTESPIETPSEEENPVTVQMLTDMVQERVHKGLSAKVKALLNSFGAERVSTLKTEDYASFYEKLGGLQ